VTLPEAVQVCKELERYHPYFIEDPLPPEQNDHFRILRQQTSVPIAMGELFNTQHEYVPLVTGRLIDFIRAHVSQIGGLSMARKLGALCEFFGVRTAWHGPGDTSPVGHAAQLALELASHNFGIHEGGGFGEKTRQVFPGAPLVKDGAMWASEAPGLGIDVDEKTASRFPFPPGPPHFDHRFILHGRFPDGPGLLKHRVHTFFDTMHADHHQRPWDGMYINGYLDSIPFAGLFVAVSFLLTPYYKAPVLVAGLLQSYVL